MNYFGEVRKMTKSIRMQVMLDLQDYLEVVNEARTYKINPKNDSELVRRIFHIFITDFPMLNIQVEQLKLANDQKKAIIDTLELTIQELKSEIENFKHKKR